MSTRAGTPPDREFAGLVLETRRLRLRQPTRADAGRMAELADDVGIAENLSTMPWPYGLDDALAFIDNTEVGFSRINLGVYLKGADDSIVGTVGLMPRDGERFALGYWIGRPHWGCGYATEATQALVDHAFERLEAPSVAATARVTNGASRRVLEKSGFQYAGQGMGPSLYHRGMVPIDRFRLERSIWTSLKSWGRHADDRESPLLAAGEV